MTQTFQSPVAILPPVALQPPVAAGYPRYAAGLVMAIGIAVLIGWATDIAVLKSGIPGLIEMKVNTAIGLTLIGLSLWLQADAAAPAAWRRVGVACATVVFALGTASLAEWVAGWDLHIDQAFIIEPPSAVYTSAPGRMAPNTAINFMCDGLALMLINWQWRGLRPSQILCAIEIVMALLALLVYVYGVGKIFGLLRFTPMAAHTAVAFLIVSSGILWARADVGPMALVTSRTGGGALMRRLLPVVVLVPLLFAWLCLRAINADLFDTSFAFALFAVSTVVFLAVPIWFNARAVIAMEQARQGQVEAAETHARELVLANTHLLELQQSKDLLTGMVIHDLRNPLSACAGLLDLAQRRNAPDPMLAQYLVQASQANDQLLELINSIIDIIRMEEAKMPTSLAMTDVTALIDAKLVQYHGAATKANVRLVHQYRHGSAHLLTDGILLSRVIENLLVNAIKHTPPNGTITIAEAPSAERKVVAIHVIDTGEGIPQADLGRIFMKYGRVEGQTMGRTYDTGLGLMFCRMAVELLRGSIWAESEPGKGSVFTIELPAG